MVIFVFMIINNYNLQLILMLTPIAQDPEYEAMKREMAEMEAETEELDQMENQVEGQIHSAAEALDENSV